jgi:hypothetical protein
MKYLQVFAVAILAVACTPPDNKEAITNDSTVVGPDTIATPVVAATSVVEEREIILDGGLTIKGEDTVIDVSNQWAFISDPYDFSLDVSTIKELLGEQAEFKEENFEGGEDYEPYSYYTVTYNESKISFYSYPGKHFSTINTPLLPLKNGIKIGMAKRDFLSAMNFTGDSISHVTLFRLFDDYGSMEFRFRADTLNVISAYYEEGD